MHDPEIDTIYSHEQRARVDEVSPVVAVAVLDNAAVVEVSATPSVLL